LTSDVMLPPPGGPARSRSSRLVSLAGPFLALLAIVLAGGIVEYMREGTLNYWSPQNQMSILTQTVTVMIGALAMTIIIISGGIDLSAGSLIALTAVASAWIAREFEPAGASRLAGFQAMWLPLAALAGGVLMGAAAGGTSGLLITRLRLMPFIVTLGMMGFARGAAKGIADQTPIRPQAATWIKDFAESNLVLWRMDLDWGPLRWRGDVAVSVALVVTLLLAVGVAVLLTRTAFGRHVFAIGSNEATARLCGVRVERTKFYIYAMAGAMFGLAGVNNYGLLAMGDPTTAAGKELDIIAAVVIGGGSLSGGSGSVLGSIIGALLMAHLHNVCVHINVPNYVQEMVVGGVIVAAAYLDQVRRRRLA
jgi:ribose transport system permease protein